MSKIWNPLASVTDVVTEKYVKSFGLGDLLEHPNGDGSII
jgi:hypothetical protein